MTPDVDTVAVGAGVVGLAVARALALRGRAVMVLERHELIGSETSSRNSEVIHAGIYYDAGSLKAGRGRRRTASVTLSCCRRRRPSGSSRRFAATARCYRRRPASSTATR